MWTSIPTLYQQSTLWRDLLVLHVSTMKVNQIKSVHQESLLQRPRRRAPREDLWTRTTEPLLALLTIDICIWELGGFGDGRKFGSAGQNGRRRGGWVGRWQLEPGVSSMPKSDGFVCQLLSKLGNQIPCPSLFYGNTCSISLCHVTWATVVGRVIQRGEVHMRTPTDTGLASTMESTCRPTKKSFSTT